MTDFVAVLLIAFLSNLFALALAIVAFRFGKMKLGGFSQFSVQLSICSSSTCWCSSRQLHHFQRNEQVRNP